MSQETAQSPQSTTQPEADWQFDPKESLPQGKESQKLVGQDERITWTASEYIAHHKTAGWYGLVAAAAAALAAVTYVLTRDKISAITIIVVGVLFCLAAARKPRVLTYALDHDGVTLGQRFRPYTEFRSFSVVREGPFSSVELLPLKRFMPLTSVYFSPEDEDDILNMLSEHIPYEERTHAFIDRFARHIHF